MNSTIEKLRGPDGMWVELDSSQIFPSDPGQGTPVLVCLVNGETASWNCATCEGETVDGTKFTPDQCDWLNEITERVESWLSENEKPTFTRSANGIGINDNVSGT